MSRNGMPRYEFAADVCTAWWRSLQGLSDEGKPHDPPRAPDRAALATLRRVSVINEESIPVVDVAAALNISAFRNLIQRLGVDRPMPDGSPEVPLEPYVIAAATLARIRSDAGKPKRGATARLLGRPRGDGANTEDRLFAEARFKRLIRTRNDWPGLMAQARRVAAILEREAPIGDLGASLILWNAEPRITRDWAFQYYQREFTSPEAEPAPANA